MKTYIATDRIAKGLYEGTISLLLVPMEPQPQWIGSFATGSGMEHHYRYGGVVFANAPEIDVLPGTGRGAIRHLAPYSVGDVVGVKEKWSRCRCGRDDCSGFLYHDSLGWNTSASGRHFGGLNMPQKAIRTRLLITSIDARLVKSIAEKEAAATGIYRGTNSRYASYPSGETIPGWNDPRQSFREYWDANHPQYPVESAWAWMFSVQKKEE